jgi:regulator of sigma E protease
MISNIITGVVVLLLFGITIFVHELGHFLVARWCGLVVDAFSIGFGPALWKRRINGVLYKIGCLPFGGYVALPQMDPAGGNPHKEAKGEEGGRDLPRVEPWKKILVSVAGVTGNVILAFVLAWIVFLKGKPSAPHETNTVVGHIETNCAAYAEGLRIGDTITAVNGEPVKKWEDIVLHMALNDHVTLAVESQGGAKTVTVPTERNFIGVWAVPGVSWMDYASVASVQAGSAAEAAGVKTGDLITGVNGETLYSWSQFVDIVAAHRDQVVRLTVRREGATLDLEATPRYDEKLGRAVIGISRNPYYVDAQSLVHPRPMAQVRDHASSIFRFLRALVTPKESGKAAQAVGGPLSIFFMIWLTVKNSLVLAIWFTGLININLAILNLLPIPVLDGGHIMFTLWEAITRRPVGPRVVNVVWNAFAILLIALFLTLTYRDVMRWIVPGFSKGPVAPASTNAAPVTSPR